MIEVKTCFTLFVSNVNMIFEITPKRINDKETLS